MIRESLCLAALSVVGVVQAQPPGGPPFGPGGFGGPPGGQTRQIVKQFDKDGDGKLNAAERAAARESIKNDRARGVGPRGPGMFTPPRLGELFPAPIRDQLKVTEEQRKELDALQKDVDAALEKLLNAEQRRQFQQMREGRMPFGGPPGMGSREPGRPGPKVAKSEVKTYPDAPLFEPTVLRTLFLDFESKDWEAELQDFRGTDVEVPATLTVDGREYPGVGVHFRGMSSYMMVPMGSKRSLNVSIDFTDPNQRLYGHKTLNLLNCNGDPSMLSSALYSHIARQYIPAPRVNLVKVVINGESWGIYACAEQFNKDFVAEHFKSSKGTARWKVSGSPGADGGLTYLGDNVAEYKRRYEIKSGDKQKDWESLIELCRVLNETPLDKLEEALRPILDIDGALWFLALDVALMNEDGYWIRASDYCLVRDSKGVFHVIPHDMNEAFKPAMMGFGGRRGGPGGPPGGPGGPGGPPPGGPGGPPGGPMNQPDGPRGGGALDLDPLVGLNDTRKPLRSRLLAVPALRQKYLENVRTIAEVWLDWQKLGPVVAQYRKLIEKEVEADTRKLASFDAFRRATSDEPAEGRPNLRAFADQRRRFLLNHPEIQKLAARREGQE